MKLYIGADFVPTDINRELFESGNIEALIGNELYTILQSADLNIFNLEVPLTDVDSPIDKFGNNLKSPTKTINAYAKLQPLLLGMANNHCYDHGYEGLTTTTELLSRNGIPYAGVGSNLGEAKKPYIFEKDGVRVGIYLCTENEFTSASAHRAGANPFDVLESFDDVATLKAQCDHVIVLYHGGKEYYQYPSPNLQRYGRKFIEKGASLVVCQHSHCIGAREDYKDGTIIYGQGNFLFNAEHFDQYQDIMSEALVLEVTADKHNFSTREIPITKTEVGIVLATPDTASKVLQSYTSRSEAIQDPHFVYESYKQFADTHINRYLREFLGRTWIVRAINGACGRKLVSLILGKTSYLAIQNFIECEAHQELFLQGLKNINRK